MERRGWVGRGGFKFPSKSMDWRPEEEDEQAKVQTLSELTNSITWSATTFTLVSPPLPELHVASSSPEKHFVFFLAHAGIPNKMLI